MSVSESVEVVLARIETKLDGVLAAAADHEARLRVLETTDHDTRLRSLESFRSIRDADYESRLRALERLTWRASGAAAILGGGLGAAVATALGS